MGLGKREAKMAKSNEQWLRMVITAEIEDDRYLGRHEEKRIEEDATRRGIAMSDIDRILHEVLEETGLVWGV